MSSGNEQALNKSAKDITNFAPWKDNSLAASRSRTRSSPRSPSLSALSPGHLPSSSTPTKSRLSPPRGTSIRSLRRGGDDDAGVRSVSSALAPTVFSSSPPPPACSPSPRRTAKESSSMPATPTHTSAGPSERQDEDTRGGASQSSVRHSASCGELSAEPHTAAAATTVAVKNAAESATAIAAAVIRDLVEGWSPCANADLPPRYRNVAGYYCDYCTYSVCDDCLAQVPRSLLEPPGASSGGSGHGELDLASSEPFTAQAPLPLAHAIAAMADDLLAGHDQLHPKQAPPLLAPGRSVSFRCHLCKRGVLVHEEALLHEWACEGPMPEVRVRRRHSVVYDTEVIQRYHFMKEQRQARAQSHQPLVARYHGYHMGAGDSALGAATLTRLAGRPVRCEEGGAFIVSVENPRLAESCVWCTVNYESRQVSPGFKGTVSVTPVLPWLCPPSLPGVAPRRYRVRVPVGAYAYGNAHAVALFLSSDIFRKATSQLAMVSPDRAGTGASPTRIASRSGDVIGPVGTPSPTPTKTPHGRHARSRRRRDRKTTSVSGPAPGAGVLGTTVVIPASAIESLLTVHIVHHLDTQPRPPIDVLSVWANPSDPSPWKMEPLTPEEQTAQEKAAALGRAEAASLATLKRGRDASSACAAPQSEMKRHRAEVVRKPTSKEGDVDAREVAGLSWPPGLASEELRLCVDHILQGRSVGVYGLGSKRFFLQHVAQSASLKGFTVVTVDGSLGARENPAHVGGGGDLGGTHRRVSHIGGSSLAARRLRDVTRYLASRLPASRLNSQMSRSGRGNAADLTQRTLDALLGLGRGEKENRTRHEASAGLAPLTDTQGVSRWVPTSDARSRSVPRDTTAGTLAARHDHSEDNANNKDSKEGPASPWHRKSSIADIIDVDDERESGNTSHPSMPESAHNEEEEAGEGPLTTPRRRPPPPLFDTQCGRSASRLPPPTQLRPPPPQSPSHHNNNSTNAHSAVGSRGFGAGLSEGEAAEEEEDGVTEMVRELAKALSTPTPTSHMAASSPASPSPRSGGASSQRLPQPSQAAPVMAPRVELGTSVRSPLQASSQAARDPCEGTHVAATCTSIVTPSPAAPRFGTEACAEGAHGGSAAMTAGLSVDGVLDLLASRSSGRDTAFVDKTARHRMREAATSFSLDLPRLTDCLSTTAVAAGQIATPQTRARGMGNAAVGLETKGEGEATAAHTQLEEGAKDWVRQSVPPRIQFASPEAHLDCLTRVRRLVGGHCTRWHCLPSVAALSLIGDSETQEAAIGTNTPPTLLSHMQEARRPPALLPPMLILVHHVDLLDAEAEAWLLGLCRRFAFPHPHVQLLVSFDRPLWPMSGLAAALESISIVFVQLRSLLLPRIQEGREVHPLDLLTRFETAASGAGVNAAGNGGGGGTSGASAHAGGLPLQDTMRRILFSLPGPFAELLHVLLAAQEEHGENHYLSLFTVGEYFEKNGILVSAGRMKAFQRELTSNRLAVYDAAEHALYIPQHRKLAKVFEEVAALRSGGGGVKGFADTTH